MEEQNLMVTGSDTNATREYHRPGRPPGGQCWSVPLTCTACGCAFTRVRAAVKQKTKSHFCSYKCAVKGRKGRYCPVNLATRLWSRVDKTDTCWLWRSDKVIRGSLVVRGTRVAAYRIAWELEHGPIPDGLWVLHKCDTPRCVRPDHLFLGTRTDNMQDAAKKGRLRTQNKNRGV